MVTSAIQTIQQLTCLKNQSDINLGINKKNPKSSTISLCFWTFFEMSCKLCDSSTGNIASKAAFLHLQEAWKDWAPFSWRSFKRSWHNFAAAKDQSTRTTTQHVLRCRLQSQGLLVSQWHSLPKGTGTFPAAYLGASSLCVRCVAMLVLPPKKLQMLCNLPNQKRTSSWHIILLNFKNQDVRNRSSHIVYSLACMLLWHWIACNRNRKKLPRGIIIRNFKSKLTCNTISVQHLQEGGMERVSPVQLAFFQTLMA